MGGGRGEKESERLLHSHMLIAIKEIHRSAKEGPQTSQMGEEEGTSDLGSVNLSH